jgi:hypothetical protein
VDLFVFHEQNARVQKDVQVNGCVACVCDEKKLVCKDNKTNQLVKDSGKTFQSKRIINVKWRDIQTLAFTRERKQIILYIETKNCELCVWKGSNQRGVPIR